MTGWPHNAYVGQEVVCIDDRLPVNPWHCKHPLVLGRVYVIDEINLICGRLAFVVDGSPRLWGFERFRPAHKTSIAPFRALLVAPPASLVIPKQKDPV